MATELAKAYVQIIPSAQGIQGAISDVLSGESSSAGKQAGENIAGSLGKKLKSTLVGLGIGKMVMDAVGNAGEFETSMAKVSTLFAGDQKQFESLQNEILNMSSAFGLGATTLAEAAYSAESAGVPMEELTTMLSGSAQLAVAGFTDIDTALSATAKTMNAYGDAAGSVEDIQKVLIQTQNLGITTVGELGASLANVTPTAAAMGVGFDQVGAALAQMTANGVPTAQATTQLRAAMTELGKAGTKADKAFREAAKDTDYAGMSFQEAMSAGANLGDVFSLMQSYADASGMSMVDLWGSVEAGNAAMTIAADVDKFNSNLKQMATDTDVVGEAYGKMSNTFGTSMNRLKESATNFMTTLFNGGDISTSFDNMLSSLGDVGEKLIGWLTTGLTTLGENLPGMMSSLLDFGASLLDSLGEVDWITLGGTIVSGIVGAMGELGTRLVELMNSAVGSVTNGEIDFASIGQKIMDGATGILGTLGGELNTLFGNAVTLLTGDGGILASFGTVGQGILDAVNGALNADGGNFLSKVFTDAQSEIEGIQWEQLGQNVAKAGSALINMTGEGLAGGFTAAYQIISTINWTELGTTVGNVANGLVKLTGETLAAAFTTAESLISSIKWEELGTTAASAANGLTNLAGETLAAAFTTAESLINGIKWEELGTTAASAANGLTNLAGETLAAAFTTAESLISAIDWAGLGTTVGTVANKLVEYSGEALAKPFEIAFDILSGIKWEEVGAAIQSGIGDVWSGVTGFLGGVLGGAGEAAAGIGSGIGTAAEGIGEAIAKLFTGDDAKQAAQGLQQAMTDMTTAIDTGKTDIETAAKNIGACIRYSIEVELNTATMNAIGSTAMSDILAGATEKEGDLDEGVAGIAKGAAAQFNTGGGWSSLGSNIVNGIISGINASSSMLVEKMKALARLALSSAKSALDIGSPSRVMRDEVGRFIPEGIALGIEQNGDIVKDAMAEISTDLAATDFTGVAARQGRSLGGISGQSSTGESGTGDIVSAIQGLRNDIRNLRLMVGEKVFGKAVVDYGGNRMNDYIGQAEGREAAGYGI